MNFPTLGPSEVTPPQPLAAPFDLPLKMPLAVDESRIFSRFKLFTVQPWLRAQGVSSVVMLFYFHVPNVKYLLHLPRGAASSPK